VAEAAVWLLMRQPDGHAGAVEHQRLVHVHANGVT
jgi:hypothetical protein